MMPLRWFESCILTPCVVGAVMMVRPVLYEAHGETQADPSHADLLRGTRPLPPSRRGDLVRPQAGDRGVDRELLAGSAHDRVRRAGAPGDRRVPDRAPRARRAPPQ